MAQGVPTACCILWNITQKSLPSLITPDLFSSDFASLFDGSKHFVAREHLFTYEMNHKTGATTYYCTRTY
jgi:hypothetical protein